MEPAWVQAGAVFRWSHDDRPMRVLLHDGEVAMYDAWWPHLRAWGLADVQRIRKHRVGYYVTLASTLAEHASHVRLEPLTADEVAIHRSDLPFAIGRCAAASWPSEAPATASELARAWRAAGCPDGAVVRAPEVYLYPIGPDGGVWAVAGARVQAADGTAFTTEELLFKAAALQAPFTSDAAPLALLLLRLASRHPPDTCAARAALGGRAGSAGRHREGCSKVVETTWPVRFRRMGLYRQVAYSASWSEKWGLAGSPLWPGATTFSAHW